VAGSGQSAVKRAADAEDGGDLRSANCLDSASGHMLAAELAAAAVTAATIEAEQSSA
jgi:hypothetical protein